MLETVYYLGLKDSGLDTKGHLHAPRYNFTAVIQNVKIKHVPKCSTGSWPMLQKRENLK